MGKPASHVDPLCNGTDAVAFAKKFKDDAATVAADLEVPVENILGLAAQESEWGRGRIARTYNNYFSMHAPAPLQIRDEPALHDAKVRVAVFDSFLASAQSFAQRFGAGVKGKANADEFAAALVKNHFNSGDSKKGGRDGFARYLADIIKNTKVRMECP